MTLTRHCPLFLLRTGPLSFSRDQAHTLYQLLVVHSWTCPLLGPPLRAPALAPGTFTLSAPHTSAQARQPLDRSPSSPLPAHRAVHYQSGKLTLFLDIKVLHLSWAHSSVYQQPCISPPEEKNTPKNWEMKPSYLGVRVLEKPCSKFKGAPRRRCPHGRSQASSKLAGRLILSEGQSSGRI